MINEISKLKEKAKGVQAENKIFFAKLKKSTPRNLDDVAHRLHDEAFDDIDCTDCANCCKTTSPIFRQNDIQRIAKRLKMRPFDLTLKNTAVCPAVFRIVEEMKKVY